MGGRVEWGSLYWLAKLIRPQITFMHDRPTHLITSTCTPGSGGVESKAFTH